MITDFVLSAIFSGINALLSLTPVMTLPGVDDRSAYFGIIRDVDEIMPIGELILGITALVSIRVGIQGWDFLVYVYHQFWGSD